MEYFNVTAFTLEEILSSFKLKYDELIMILENRILMFYIKTLTILKTFLLNFIIIS